MDGIAQAAATLERRLEAESFGALDAAIERDPSHHFRENVVPALAAPLPDAVIGLVPDLGEMFQHRAFQSPALVVELQFGHARLVKGVDQLAVDVELQLRMRGIADPDRPRAFIAGQPIRLPFQAAAAGP